MTRRLLVLLFAILALSVPASGLAQETGSISGTVTNGTEGGGDVAGETITLSRFQGMNLVEEYTAEVGSDGSYAFTDLPMVEGEAYIVRIDYAGVQYSGEMILAGEEADTVADLQVFETTQDPEAISFVSRGVIVSGADPETRLVEMFEILAVDNTTDRTYIGQDGWVMRVPLPDGAAQITPQPGFNYGEPRMENGQFVTTGPIYPGNQNAMIAYSVPYSGTEATLNVGTAMSTGTLRVLVREGLFSISSPALNDGGTVEVGGDTYHVLSVDKPIIGDSVAVRISDLPKTGSTGDPSRTNLYVGIGAGVGLLAAGGLVFQTLYRRGRTNAAAVETDQDGQPTSPEEERIALAAELNQLDEDLAAGHIDQDTYQSERDEILEELRALSERQRAAAAAEA